MEPRIELLPPTTLIGLRQSTSWLNDQTSLLWRTFRARRAEVTGRIDGRSWSVQRYGAAMAAGLMTPATVFEKWAAVKVPSGTAPAAGFETLRLGGGPYAVFRHHGPASAWPQTAQRIFEEWLPASAYRLADRDHFEIFGDAYRPLDPAATEDIWVPIMARDKA